MSSISMLMMSAIYIFNSSQGKYLSVDANGKATLSATPAAIELTETSDGTNRFDDASGSKTEWVFKCIGNVYGASSDNAKKLYTIGCNIKDAYATGFLYAANGIATTYTEPDASFQDGVWQILTQDDIDTEDVTLSEENITYTVPQLNKTYTNIRFTRKFAKNAWNSLCVPFPISSEQLAEQFGEGAKVAVYKDFDMTDKVLRFETADRVEAGKPCLLYPTSTNADMTYTFLGVESAAWDKNTEPKAIAMTGQPTYCGIYRNIGTAPMGSYIFGGNNKMYYVNSSVKLKGFRAYFTDDSSAAGSAKQLSWGFADNTTSIEITPGGNATTPADIYKTDGSVAKRKATTTSGLRPGVYIMNGMKVVVK